MLDNTTSYVGWRVTHRPARTHTGVCARNTFLTVAVTRMVDEDHRTEQGYIVWWTVNDMRRGEGKERQGEEL
jgi:hypothetical protein